MCAKVYNRKRVNLITKRVQLTELCHQLEVFNLQINAITLIPATVYW